MIPVEEAICIRTAARDVGTAGEVSADERGPIDADAYEAEVLRQMRAEFEMERLEKLADERGPMDTDAVGADAQVADAVAAVDAAEMREAIGRALGISGASWCSACGWFRCRCGGAS